MWFSNSKPNPTDSKHWYLILAQVRHYKHLSLLNENTRKGQPYYKSTIETMEEDNKKKMKQHPFQNY